MNGAELLHRLGAGAAVRSALALLPPPFAEAFAAEAVRLVEAGRVPVRPVEEAGEALPVPRSLPPETRRVLLMETRLSRGGVGSLAVARWRVLDALLGLSASRLDAAARGFLIVRTAWEGAHGRPLAPAGEDWPTLQSEPFREVEG